MENEDQSIDYEQLFGIELNDDRDDDREDNSGTADPEGEIDDGMQETAPHEEGAADGTGDDDRGTETETQPQTQEDAGAAPHQTTEQELDAAIAHAVQEAIERNEREHKAKLEAFFQKAQLKNTFTGEVITDMDSFDKWNSEFSAAKLEQDLKAGRLTPEALQAVIAQTPALQQIQQVIEKQAADNERLERQAQAQQAKAVLDEQIAKISEMDPAIKTVEDLMGSDHYDQVYGLVKDGYRLADAYKLVNFDRLTRRTAAASRQQAHNQAMGKRHLQQTQARGNGAVEVPGNIRQAYRELMPNATDAEIRENYARYLKSNERRN